MKAQMGDKLAASVRGAKKQQSEAQPAAATVAADTTTVDAAAKPAPAPAARDTASVKETIPFMPSRRVWPD